MSGSGGGRSGTKKDDFLYSLGHKLCDSKFSTVTPEYYPFEKERINKDIAECRKLVLEAFCGNTVKTDIWFYTKNPHLGHITPFELIRQGRGDKVMAFITNAIEENKRADGMDKYLDDRRASLSDAVLLRYFKIILAQAKDGHDREEMLLKYINELEYRGLKYKLDL